MLGLLYDCHTAELTELFGAFQLLGSDVWMIKVRLKGSVQTSYCHIITFQGRKCTIPKKLLGNGKVD